MEAMDDRRESKDKSIANIYGLSTVCQVLKKAFSCVSQFSQNRKIRIIISTLEMRKPRLRKAE